jgi:Fur family transcriptional regulator, zinc uptake regulator
VHHHAAGDLVVFLICEICGAVGEASSAEVAGTIRSAANAVGFRPKSPVIEVSGICTHCGASR